MRRSHPRRLGALAFVLAALAGPAGAATLDLAFMPPEVEPQEICAQAPAQPGVVADAGATDDAIFSQYLRRDIHDLSAEDADRWFDFIAAMIGWQAELDPGFAGAAPILARIALHVDAGRLDALHEADLFDQLRSGDVPLTNVQKQELAQYYLNGLGVDQDVAYAHELLSDAAYGGNVDALMTVARLDLMGQPVEGWDAPLDLTVTLAFGGMLGQMNPEVCDHAERIAAEYLGGDVVTRNLDVAYAWTKFAADLGSARAAWRVAEMHMGPEAVRDDDTEMLRYLRLAAARGYVLDAAQIGRVRALGAAGEAALREGGPDESGGAGLGVEAGPGRPSLASQFRLVVNRQSDEVDKDDPYLRYLRALARLDATPGWVFTRLANQVLIHDGRWAGEAEAIDLLEEAAGRGDGEGTQLLGEMLVRRRDDPVELERAVNLMIEAVDRFGRPEAMQDLDRLFRCQANDAPRRAEAEPWAEAYRATQAETVGLSATDLISLDPVREPETLAQLQTQALQGDPLSLANFLERVQADPSAGADVRSLWAQRAQRSDKALEAFAILEFTLATTPVERDRAIALFRRVYLNNGVTTALDLAVALTELDGRVPEVDDEIVTLLVRAANRGEGGAIRLLARLSPGPDAEREVYERFAAIIEERGDFLALMFAMPFVSLDLAADYDDRAVTLMGCTVKDADELGDAAAILESPEMTYHWRQVGLAVEGGHPLSRLGLSIRQMAAYGTGAAPSEADVLARDAADGDRAALRDLYDLAADPGLRTYDPAAAATHLIALLGQGGEGGSAADEAWVLARFRAASLEVRAAAGRRFDIAGLTLRAAQRGDVGAKLDLALLLRAQATGPVDLQASTRWLGEAAEAGDVAAMAELGRSYALGLGVAPDRAAALDWLGRAARGGNAEAADLARLLGLEAGR